MIATLLAVLGIKDFPEKEELFEVLAVWG